MKQTLTFSAVAFAAVIALSLASGSAHAVTCKGKVYATGSKALTWAGARVRAKTKWRAKAIGTYGAVYGSWVLSGSKSLHCWKSGVKKQCRAGGRPCRP